MVSVCLATCTWVARHLTTLVNPARVLDGSADCRETACTDESARGGALLFGATTFNYSVTIPKTYVFAPVLEFQRNHLLSRKRFCTSRSLQQRGWRASIRCTLLLRRPAHAPVTHAASPLVKGFNCLTAQTVRVTYCN